MFHKCLRNAPYHNVDQNGLEKKIKTDLHMINSAL